MAAYVIGEIEITDPATYEDYRKQVLAVVTKYGGKFIARGGRTETLEGEPPARRVVVLEFPSLEQAQKSDGNLGVDALADANNAWWTVTSWQERRLMHSYVRTEPHRIIQSHLDRYCDEAYAILSRDFLMHGRAPNGFDLPALRADLELITA